MTYLERLRFDPLLFEVLESVLAKLAECLDDVETEDEQWVSVKFSIDSKVPDSLRKMWEITNRVRSLPIATSDQCGLAVEPSKLILENGEFAAIDTSPVTRANPNHYLVFATGSAPEVHWGTRYCENRKSWIICEMINQRIVTFPSQSIDEFLVDWALFNLSATWIREERLDEFEKFHSFGTPIWTAQSGAEFWYHPDGVVGVSFRDTLQRIRHRLAMKGERVRDLIGRPPHLEYPVAIQLRNRYSPMEFAEEAENEDAW